ncbi:acVLRF1 family peptidyl-tRNA hydrolase [Nocardioides sp. CCNWLW239]|uniref:acVLRF1 family peptidyl-tRNA hydrolase n=1 Tax=Nocardioides sp. CCNWLW239 TaxID=3128902 RepID=UPI003018B582
MPNVAVPVARIQRWVDNFAGRHGDTLLSVDSGALTGAAEDGSSFIATLPFEKTYVGPAEVEAFIAASSPPRDWGLLLVRKGGFAIARMSGGDVTDHKIGRRHVQGKTKAGGWSQQRFARRRANQASAAYEAAAEHAARILEGLAGPLVTGGDHSGVDDVLGDRRLSALTVTGPWLAVPDPNRAVLDQAIEDAQKVHIEVLNADG